MSNPSDLVRNGMNGGLLSAMQGGRKNKSRNNKNNKKNRRSRRRRRQQGGSRAQNEQRVGYGFRGGVQEEDTRHFMGSYAPFEKMSGGRRRRRTGGRRRRRTGRGSSRFRRSRYHKKRQLKNKRRHTRRRQRGGSSAYTPSLSIGGEYLDKHSSALATPPLFSQTNNCVDTYKHA